MVLIALLLIVEGLSTGLWVARVVTAEGAFGPTATVLMVLRGLVGAVQLTGGVFLLAGRRASMRLSQFALIASALLTTLEIGLRLTPNNLVPSLRWPLVAAYWIYAVGAAGYLAPKPEVRVNKSWKVRGDKNEKVLADKNQEVMVDENAEVLVDKNTEVLPAHDVTEPAPSEPDVARTPSEDPSESGERPRLFD